jgi:NADH-quinone oxidoreductase subunit M
MAVLTLLLIPFISGLFLFIYKGDAKFTSAAAYRSSLAVLAVAVLSITQWNQPEMLTFSQPWLSSMGSTFTLQLDGLGKILVLLNAIAFVLLTLYNRNKEVDRSYQFYGWLLLAQAGMMGVFMAMDGLLFYFFWELALIPMYFLASQWGGPRRIAVTFKFFIYTFVGSVLMLIGLLYLQSKTVDQSFALESLLRVPLTNDQQSLLFGLFFVAFAVKIPVFPFHTWQPDAYEQAPTPVTTILSAVMVKMGVLGLLRWLLPLFPVASYMWGDVIMTLGVISIVYASLLAWRQQDLKRLVAYSSIAHLGLMTVAAFAVNYSAIQGLLIQLFSHGINVMGMWLLLDIIERKTGTRQINELGGIAQTSPLFTILFLIIALANIALPLTNAFIGEFLMFNGILATKSNYYWVFAAIAGIGIILSAVYTLNMVRLVFYGDTKETTAKPIELEWHEKIALGTIVLLILVFGIYPQPLLDITSSFAQQLIGDADISALFRKS